MMMMMTILMIKMMMPFSSQGDTCLYSFHCIFIYSIFFFVLCLFSTPPNLWKPGTVSISCCDWMSHDEVVFIKWDIEMEGAQRGGLSILLWLSQDQKSI